MNRSILPAAFALAAAIALLVLPGVATARTSLKATTELSLVEHDGKYYVYAGTGAGTVVGHFSIVSRVQFKGHTALGTVTWMATNGDSLDVQTTQEPGGDGTYEGTYTIVGGTGRFADASGSGTVMTTVNADGTVIGHFDGTLNL